VGDDQHPDHPSTSKTDEKVDILIVRNDRRLGIRMIDNMVNVDKKLVRHDKLNMKKVCAKMLKKQCVDSAPRHNAPAHNAIAVK